MPEAPHTLVPVLALRDTVVFPGTVVPLLLGRETSVRSVELAMAAHDSMVFLSLQVDPGQEQVRADGLRKIGVMGRVSNHSHLPGGMVKINVEGLDQAVVKEWVEVDGFPMRAIVNNFQLRSGSKTVVASALSSTLELMEAYAKERQDIPSELLSSLREMDTPRAALMAMIPFLPADPTTQQSLLEANDFNQLAQMIRGLIEGHLEVLRRNQRLEQEVRMKVQRGQRDFLLREQIRLLQEELESAPELSNPEIKALRDKMTGRSYPTEVLSRIEDEMRRLGSLQIGSPEYGVARNYLETLISLPFGIYTKESSALPHVRKVLNQHHHGLDKVKERILEHVAVLSRPREENRSPILCLVGPPGVGKTSLASSVAEALGRPFARVALGGVRDEAEIRGHRRTYIGSLPGRIAQAIKKSGAMNPVILLDEMDKMSADHRGDPGSALLEVLDPEQNPHFSDHYLEIGLDLSRVFFIATANIEHAIPEVLRDRLEMIRLPGYFLQEKETIAAKHLLPRLRRRIGLSPEEFELPAPLLRDLIRSYTRESGVRNLDRHLEALGRKRALEIALRKKYVAEISKEQLPDYLGPIPYLRPTLEGSEKPGIVTGLAWTSTGGDTLKVEVSLLSGKGRLKLTGTLGEVMKESVHIALTLVRERCMLYGIDPDLFNKTDIHVHVPEGATPKDGPSAGITLTLALMSAFSRRPINPKWTFTGEVSLSGKVHAIGGLPEKTLASLDAGGECVFFPEDNAREIPELPKAVRKGLKLNPVEHIDTLLKKVLPPPSKAERKAMLTGSKPRSPKAESSESEE